MAINVDEVEETLGGAEVGILAQHAHNGLCNQPTFDGLDSQTGIVPVAVVTARPSVGGKTIVFPEFPEHVDTLSESGERRYRGNDDELPWAELAGLSVATVRGVVCWAFSHPCSTLCPRLFNVSAAPQLHDPAIEARV
ncbi:hypothetical protein FRC07_013598 [Ceratobasidium sp. 392]|nr:hypothetical protein FRC07_013598 [Ceratobasidium sp. 392]